MDKIKFHVVDATLYEEIISLKRKKLFTKAVSNMAIMDITDIKPLFKGVYELLEDKGIFVFAIQHPCFVTLSDKYMTSNSYYGVAIEGQPKVQCYYHRSMQELFNICFEFGFVIDGFAEVCYKYNKEIPEIIVVKARKK